MDATAQLLNLRAELVARGWHAELHGPTEDPRLYVANPRIAQLHEQIEFRDGHFRWPVSGEIGPADSVGDVAARIMRVLRAPGPGHTADGG